MIVRGKSPIDTIGACITLAIGAFVFTSGVAGLIWTTCWLLLQAYDALVLWLGA